MNLHRIEQFIAVADTGSIRGAARRTGESQPAMTRALQQLEEELGVQLMQRSVHGVSLTVAGASFLGRARVAHAELRMAVDEAKRSPTDRRETVSLGVSPSAASLLLPEFVTALQGLRPGVRIRLHESNPSSLLPMVREEALDLAVTARTRSHLDAGLLFRQLFEIQMRVVVRAGHPLAGTTSLEDLVSASWLSMAIPDSPSDLVRQSFLAAGLPAPVPAVHCGSHSVALDLIGATDLVGLLPPALLQTQVKQGRLVELRLRQPIAPLLAGLYRRAEGPQSAVVKVASQVIVSIARRLAAGGGLRNMEPVVPGPPSRSSRKPQ